MKSIILTGALVLLTPSLSLAQAPVLRVHSGPAVHDRSPRIHDRAPRIHDNHQVVRS